MTPTTQDAGLIKRARSWASTSLDLTIDEAKMVFALAERLEALSQPSLAGPPEPELVAAFTRVVNVALATPRVPQCDFEAAVETAIASELSVLASPVPAPKPTEEEVAANG